MQVEGLVVIYNPWWSGGEGVGAPASVDRYRHQARPRKTRVAALMAHRITSGAGGTNGDDSG
jgi:hypothetical protein